MPQVFIGIGSNEGDRFSAISKAVQQLASSSQIALVQMAPIIETKPVGGPPQGDYLNTVVEINTDISARDIWVLLKEIEKRLGRVVTSVRWGPRPIDLDILLYGDTVINTPDLQVPHPRMHERFFVLQPLAELAPDLIHPILQQSMTQLLQSAAASKDSVKLNQEDR